MHYTYFIILFFSFSFTALGQTEQEIVSEPKDSTLIWQITKADSKDTSYLLGTIHLPLKAAFYCIDTAQTLMKRTNRAFFEIVVNQEAIGEQAYYFLAQEEKDRISFVLDSGEQAQLYALGSKLMGPGAAVLRQLKPIGAYSVLTMSMLPMDTSNSMDILYQEKAKEWGIPVASLETIEDQFDVLDTIQKYGSRSLLLELINNPDQLEADANELLKAYLNQDLPLISQLIHDEFSTVIDQKVRQYLLNNRNIKMATNMINAAEVESCFFAIGAAHLVGDTGVIQALRRHGYTVQAIAH